VARPCLNRYGYGSYGGGGAGGGGAGGGEPETVVGFPAFTCPRISPAGFVFVWTLTYVLPARIVFSCVFVMFAVPRCPLLHGPHRATMTFPAFPGLPLWM
jgi:hypothetical protein